MSSDFYVYVYTDPRVPGEFTYGDFTFRHKPFYVGKGKGRRMYEHIRLVDRDHHNPHKTRTIRKIIDETGHLPFVMKILEGFTEDEALSLEQYVIYTIGRLDLNQGPLLNLTDGGDGATNMSESTRRLISERMVGSANPNWGGACMTDSHVSKLKLNGENNFFYGRRHTTEVKQRIADARRADSEATKRKRSESFKRTRAADPSKFCKTYELVSPDGTVYIVDTGLDKFCDQHGLNQPILSKMLRMPDYSPSRGACVGWSIRTVTIT